MVNVLLVGSGAREHAIAAALCRSKDAAKFYAFTSTNHPGIARLAKMKGGEAVAGKPTDANAVAKFARERNVDLAVIGPEAVMEAGVVDVLERMGIRCASPTQSAARLETDKAFARELLKKHGVSGQPEFGAFTDATQAARFIDSIGGNVVVKPVGLTAGKGVKVVGVQLKDASEAAAYAREVIEKGIGGRGGVVIEEKLVGEEFTLQAFVSSDGSMVGMPAVQDHKLAFEGDRGPNTGGMGAYSDANHLLPFLTQEEYDACLGIMEASVAALKAGTGVSYRGALYGQFMLTSKGPYLIEFNARFGDPEAMNVLTLLESDYVGICECIAYGTRLAARKVCFARKATVCKYIVPNGYPDSPEKGKPVSIDEPAIARTGATLYYGAVDRTPDGKTMTTGSRTVALVGVADSISDAEKKAEAACGLVGGDVFHRRDIGKAALIQRRVQHMRTLRGAR